MKQLQDDYETLSEQAQFTQSHADDLDVALQQSAEDQRRAISAGVARACVAQSSLLQAQTRLTHLQHALTQTECRADGEELFKLAQERLTVKAEQKCDERDREIVVLAEELEVVDAYAQGMRSMLVGREDEEEVGGGQETMIRMVTSRKGWEQDANAVTARVEMMEQEARSAASDASLLRVVMEEGGCHGRALVAVEELEQSVFELKEGEDRLLDEAWALKRRIEDLEVSDIRQCIHSCGTALPFDGVLFHCY